MSNDVALVALCVLQEELRAQMPRYQRSIPRQGQTAAAVPSVCSVGGMMAPQQPGMRPSIPGIQRLPLTY